MQTLDLNPEEQAELDKNFPSEPEKETAEETKPTEPEKETAEETPATVSPDEILGALQGLGTKLEEISSKRESSDDPEKPEGWKPKSWEEVAARAADEAQKALSDREQAQKDADAQREDNLAKLDKDIQGRVSDLEKAGRIPKMVDPKNESDPGVQARKELFAYASQFNTLEFGPIIDTLEAAHAAHKYFDYKTFKWVDKSPNPGKDAPISSSSATTPPPTDGPDYKTIRGLTLDQLASRGMQQE